MRITTETILAEIKAGNDFAALAMILTITGQATASTANFAAWTIGPIEGQSRISDYIETEGLSA